MKLRIVYNIMECIPGESFLLQSHTDFQVHISSQPVSKEISNIITLI